MARAGWVLTGGASSRMGSDKALLYVDGQAMALRAAETVAKVCGKASLVGDPARYVSLGLPVVSDNFPGFGPLAGIEAALSATSADWNLIVACDMPALDIATLEKLFTAGGDCALPEYEDGRLEPLCAVYHRRCHGVIRSALERGIRKVTDALRGGGPPSGLPLAIRYVRVTHAEPFANLNTPADVGEYAKKRHIGNIGKEHG